MGELMELAAARRQRDKLAREARIAETETIISAFEAARLHRQIGNEEKAAAFDLVYDYLAALLREPEGPQAA